MAELLARISSRELTEWAAYYQVEPFGEERADLRSAIVATNIANGNRAKGQKPYKIEDFMPKFEKKSQSREEMIQVAAMMTAALGGQDRRGGEDGNTA